MKKSTFDKLPKAKQRVVIAKDVIKRMKERKLKPRTQVFCSIPDTFQKKKTFSLKTYFNTSKRACEACAKGGLFMSFVGINNVFKNTDDISVDLSNQAMKSLAKIFPKKQLAMIEVAFERNNFSYNNLAKLSEHEKDKCVQFYDSIKNTEKEWQKDYFTRMRIKDKRCLTAIMNNIIINKGTFKP